MSFNKISSPTTGNVLTEINQWVINNYQTRVNYTIIFRFFQLILCILLPVQILHSGAILISLTQCFHEMLITLICIVKRRLKTSIQLAKEDWEAVYVHSIFRFKCIKCFHFNSFNWLNRICICWVRQGVFVKGRHSSRSCVIVASDHPPEYWILFVSLLQNGIINI